MAITAEKGDGRLKIENVNEQQTPLVELEKFLTKNYRLQQNLFGRQKNSKTLNSRRHHKQTREYKEKYKPKQDAEKEE